MTKDTKELREKIEELYLQTHYSVVVAGTAKLKVMAIKDILKFHEAVEKLIHQERQKAREEIRREAEKKLQRYSVESPQGSRIATFTPKQFISVLEGRNANEA